MLLVLAGMVVAGVAQYGEPTWQDNFDLGGIDESRWDLELAQGGGGNGEFEMYVNSEQTASVRLGKPDPAPPHKRNGVLHIRPQLTEKIMEELHEHGDDWSVPRQEHWLSDPKQPISGDADFYYADSVGGAFAGRRLVLPFKHARYTTNTTNVCNDNVSSDATQPGCENMWASRYNAMDLGTQVWPSGNFKGSKCSSDCFHHSGDWFTVNCDEPNPADCPANKVHYDMLQPISSAKLITRMKLDARFGRLEVRAKLPRGDWLWPAIWMMPSFPNTYGHGWPLNGEIDIVESRGNTPEQCDAAGGYNSVQSTLHWGPSFFDNQYSRTMTQGKFQDDKAELTEKFNTFGLAWDETGLYTYINDDSNRLLELNRSLIGDSFWQFAQTPSTNCHEKSLNTDGSQSCTKTVTTPVSTVPPAPPLRRCRLSPAREG